MNGIKTVLLLGLLSGLLLVGGQAVAGESGLYLGFGLAVVMNFASYFFSEKIALMAHAAQPVTETENAAIYHRVAPLVRSLTQQMGIPMPRLWVIPEEAPNAFATGRNPSHSSVAFTAGLLELLDDRELEGVIAHELAHVKNRDILISSVAATLAAAITMIGRMAFFFGGSRDEEDRGSPLGALVMMIVAPLAAVLIQMAISRTREFSADATAARYAGAPDGLIRALRKLEMWSRRIPMDAQPAMAHMYIVKPLTGGSLMRLFSTHPSTEQRIAKLEALGG